MSRQKIFIQEERHFYAECQECEERITGDTKKEVREKLKSEKWLTKRWCPKGYDFQTDMMCPGCVKLYTENYSG